MEIRNHLLQHDLINEAGCGIENPSRVTTDVGISCRACHYPWPQWI